MTIYRVLVVEDDELTARMLNEMTSESFIVEWVSTLNEAIDLMLNKRIQIDAVLADLTLPNGRGLETIRRLKAIAGNIPILVYTGGSTTFSEARSAGAVDLMYKPTATQEIIKRTIKAIATCEVDAKFAPLQQQLQQSHSALHRAVKSCRH